MREVATASGNWGAPRSGSRPNPSLCRWGVGPGDGRRCSTTAGARPRRLSRWDGGFVCAPVAAIWAAWRSGQQRDPTKSIRVASSRCVLQLRTLSSRDHNGEGGTMGCTSPGRVDAYGGDGGREECSVDFLESPARRGWQEAERAMATIHPTHESNRRRARFRAIPERD